MKQRNGCAIPGIMLLTCCAILNGCATATPEVVLESHGDSVRNMIAEQTYTPADEGSMMDGDKSRTALQTYRAESSDTKAVEQEIIQIKFD